MTEVDKSFLSRISKANEEDIDDFLKKVLKTGFVSEKEADALAATMCLIEAGYLKLS